MMAYIPINHHVFVIDIEYKVSLDKVAPYIEAHMAFLQKYYDARIFLASGAKVPRSGGMIIAVGQDKDNIAQLIKEDPFYQHELADYRITEFMPRMSAPGLTES